MAARPGMRNPDMGRPGTPIDLWGAGLATLALGAMATALTETKDVALPATVVAICAGVAFVWVERRLAAPMIMAGPVSRPQFQCDQPWPRFCCISGLNGDRLLPADDRNFRMACVAPWRDGNVPANLDPDRRVLAKRRAVVEGPRSAPGWPMAIGSLLVAVAYTGIAVCSPGGGDFWHRILPFSPLAAAGMALLVAPLTAAAMAHAPEADQGAASGINNATARAAALIAVALMGRIAFQVLWARCRRTCPATPLPDGSAAHQAATSLAFAHVAAMAAVMALAAGLVSAFGLIRRRPSDDSASTVTMKPVGPPKGLHWPLHFAQILNFLEVKPQGRRRHSHVAPRLRTA